MYQFTELFSEMNPTPQRRSYRWRGLLLGLLGGWIPAWGIAQVLHHGWFFALAWAVMIPLGYGIGYAIVKR